MDKKVSSVIASHLRALRRVRVSNQSLVDIYEAEFKGAISALCDLGLIDHSKWWRLQCLSSKFSLRVKGIPWPVIKKSYRPSRSQVEAVQDEPEQVSAPAAPEQLRLLGVLDASVLRPATGQPLKSSAYVNIESFDGLRPDRIEFPRLGKHWSPASVLVGYQERKGHAVCRA